MIKMFRQCGLASRKGNRDGRVGYLHRPEVCILSKECSESTHSLARDALSDGRVVAVRVDAACREFIAELEMLFGQGRQSVTVFTVSVC